MSSEPVSSGPETIPSKHKVGSPLITAIIGALAVIFAAILAALIPVLITQPRHHFGNRCIENLTIKSPSDGQPVTSSPTQGVDVTGTACNLNGSTGWLFDHDLGDGYYFLDYSTNSPTPVADNNGGWAYYDMNVGNKGDKNVAYQITAVLASPLCTEELEGAKADSAGYIKFRNFPSGCQVEDTVGVVVTYP